jgi:hypothetical protein
MAVEDKYVGTLTAAGKLEKAALVSGDKIIVMVATEETAAADDDGSVYRFFKSVPSNLIPVEITIVTDGITGMTDTDLGLYKVGVGGAVVDKDVLMDGQTLASALTRASGHQLGLANVNIADLGKTLAELSAQTKPDLSYDICLTANTVGSGAATVSIIAKFIQG